MKQKEVIFLANDICEINEKFHSMNLNTTQASTTAREMKSGNDVHQGFLSQNKEDEKICDVFTLEGELCKGP